MLSRRWPSSGQAPQAGDQFQLHLVYDVTGSQITQPEQNYFAPTHDQGKLFRSPARTQDPYDPCRTGEGIDRWVDWLSWRIGRGGEGETRGTRGGEASRGSGGNMSAATRLVRQRAGDTRLRLRLAIRGAVQGVGFRPFIYRLAHDLHLPGLVSNSAQGVFVEVEGSQKQLEQFLIRIELEKPPRASNSGTGRAVFCPRGTTRCARLPTRSGGVRLSL